MNLTRPAKTSFAGPSGRRSSHAGASTSASHAAASSTSTSSSSAIHAHPGFLFANFNQDYGCFAVGLDSGFRIFNTDPLKEKMRRDFAEGGIGQVEMLFRSNYLALVGGGKNPQFPPNKVILWDDSKHEVKARLEFKSEVRAVKMRRDRIVVALLNKVSVYSLSVVPQLLHSFETAENEAGVLALSSDNTASILAIPGRQFGHIQTVDLNSGASANSVPAGNGSSISSSGLPPTTAMSANVSIITAHTTRLSCLAINAEGTKLASASEKGTLIRVFHAGSGKLLNELRRGVDRAEIYSIAFSHDSTRLCVASDKGTIHIFNLELGASDLPGGGPHFSFMRDLLPKYFSSEWSFAHFRVSGDVRCLCAFGNERNSIIVLCSDGSCYKYIFDPLKGNCVREWYRKFLS
ncbi:WD40-repeat-containing domain protein [Dimargaris cristalligena]|uniref:WD40-repeat-containing domain protein n=1 Tax=Dimargaris cristalligena TaxID=215637 RepID=A0A4P9ZZJ2_9FUNG|nr:WD40-repeat-containing domain protein [Dimargaris cristalligena]|eukprot:RKP39163.1 WD40-repeat-containing domain protein [Dimargaris cristalligena]